VLLRLKMLRYRLREDMVGKESRREWWARGVELGTFRCCSPV
jgi:hypothetical protein